MCGVLVDEKQEEKLRKIGVKDSKLIGRKKRNELFSKIKKIVKDYKIIIVEPKEIDKAVEGHDGLNLNWLEAKKSCMIINELNPDKAYIDSPSNNVVKYKNYVRKYIKNKKIELVVEHKADQKFISVSAASILANVTRDSEIMKIKKQIGVDIGSGYLADSKTIKFMKEHYEKHSKIFRKSWSPYKQLMSKKVQSNLEDFTKFLKEPSKSSTVEKMKKLEDLGYRFVTPKSEHELAIMKGPCTIILYKSGKLLIQGREELKRSVKKLLEE